MAAKRESKSPAPKSATDLIAADVEHIAGVLDVQVADLTFLKYERAGGSFAEWEFRKRGGFRQFVSDAFGVTHQPADIVSIRGTARRNREFRRLEREFGDLSHSRAWIEDMMARVFEVSPIRVSPYKPKSVKRLRASQVERWNVGHFSDIHWGINIDPFEVEGNVYNMTVAARRFAKVVDALANYKLDHRSECGGLVMNFAGDILQGCIHIDDANQDLMCYQVAAAAQYITAAIDYLLNFYDAIRVPMTPGNHDRVITPAKGLSRTTAQKYDNFLTMVFTAVQMAFRQDPRVTFEVPRTPYTTFKIFDRTWATTHFDTVLQIMSPDKSVDVAKLASQLDRINAGLPDSERIQALLGGHVHTCLYLGLSNDVDLFVNPSLSGTDAFAQSIGFLRSRRGQWIIESTRDYRVGDHRCVWAEDADADAAYDAIIPPFDYGLVVKKLAA